MTHSPTSPPAMRRRTVATALGLLLFLLALGCIASALAQQRSPLADSLATQNELLQRVVRAMENEERVRDPAPEIDGLLVNQTLTKIGADFYELFFQRWEAPASASDYTIQVEEMPAPGFGTMVVIKINDATVYQRVLQPRYDQLEASAQQAVAVVSRHVLDQQQLGQQLYDEDQQGTGIY